MPTGGFLKAIKTRAKTLRDGKQFKIISRTV